MSRSGYWALPDADRHADDGTDIPPVFVETGHRSGKGQWSQISDLDDFFRRVYRYHQRHGFLAIFCEDCLKLMQYMFVVIFCIYLAQCVHYDDLFNWMENHLESNATTFALPKIYIADTVDSPGVCLSKTSKPLVACLVFALLFWLFWLVKIIHSVVKNWEVRRFYNTVLNIADSDLPDLTWSKDVLPRIIHVQQEVELCVHKASLTELDICQRILRFNNYMVAMVYRHPEPLLPLKINVICVGPCYYVSSGLLACLEMVLFWRGPNSPFQTNWHLRDDYKRADKRELLATQLRQRAGIIGLINLIFLPVIFVWQLLYLFLSYTTLIRKDPTWLGSRRWSTYGRLYGRLFNELDHQLDSRLSRAYGHAKNYMASFPSHPLLIILCRGLLFFSSSILAVLLVLTLIDSEVIRVEGMLLLMTSLGIIATMSGSVLPDENLIYAPDMLLTDVQHHYRHLPSEWVDKAQSRVIRDEFASLFQYKAVWLLEELLSPLISAYILLFRFPYSALQIVDFLRNFTVDVVGVGDVCSFAAMNVDTQSADTGSGKPPSVSPGGAPSTQAASGGVSYGATRPGDGSNTYALQQAPPEFKAEMSLIQFALANPGWRPDGGVNQRSMVSKARNEVSMTTSALQQQQMSSMMIPGIMQNIDRPVMEPSIFQSTTTTAGGPNASQRLRGPGMSRLDDYPSIVTPVMDRRRIIAATTSADSSLLLSQHNRRHTLVASDNNIELGVLGNEDNKTDDKQPLMSASGPAVVHENEEEEIDPFASLVPLGVPQWSPNTMDLIGMSGHEQVPQRQPQQGLILEHTMPEIGNHDQYQDPPQNLPRR